MRSLVTFISLSVGLAACQGQIDSAEMAPPSGNTIAAAVKQVAAEAKLAEPLETTALRRVNFWAGDWIVCVREASLSQPPAYPYAIFFDSAYKRSRIAVGVDEC